VRRLVVLIAAALGAYSAVLVGLELREGRGVLVYLDDPPAPTHFLHVHTEVSSALLVACAVVFGACRRAEARTGRRDSTSAAFLDTQVVLFLFLAADERFRLLASLTERLGVPEAAPYLLLGAVEGALLLGPGRLLDAPSPARDAAAAGAFLFAISLAMDSAPARLPLRWCAEDLPKVWGGALFLFHAARRLDASLDALAFPGAGGEALVWARTARTGSEPEGSRVTPGIASRAPAARQGKGASARRTDAPEPEPKHEASDSSAAPPRKLLSH
jgi:hypothetical protein